MSCKHEQIRTWVFEDTEESAGMWSCVKCGLKFEPINQRKPLTDEEIKRLKPISADFVSFRAGVRCMEREYGIGAKR